MRKVTLALSAAVALSLVAQSAAAQVRWLKLGPEIGLGTNGAGAAIGGRAVFTGLGEVTNLTGLAAYASFDYFLSTGSPWEINLNGTWDIPSITGPLKPYVGAGLNYAHASGGSSSGLNLLGGTHFRPTPALDTFGEIRIELRSGSLVAFTIGVLF